MKIFLNPLSLNGTCNTPSDVLEVVKPIIDCVKYCTPMIEVGNAEAYIDPRIDSNKFVDDETINQSISRIDNDYKTLWYIYTKNKMTLLDWESVSEVEVSNLGENTTSGEVHSDLVNQDGSWLSFNMSNLFSNQQLNVLCEGRDTTKTNISSLEQMVEFLPFHEHNPKHRREAYTREGGEYVSPMPLDQNNAQELLLRSVLDDGGDRWAKHNASDKYYRFKKTHIDRNVYHGFQTTIADIPDAIFRRL